MYTETHTNEHVSTRDVYMFIWAILLVIHQGSLGPMVWPPISHTMRDQGSSLGGRKNFNAGGVGAC